MKRTSTMLVTLLGLMSLSLPAMAHEDGACRDDVKKFCGDVKPGEGGIRDCMKSHEADLSAGCKANIADMKAKMEAKKKEMEQACGADLKKYCANVTPGEGREFACLHSYSDKISVACKAAMPKPGMGMHHHDGPPQEGAAPDAK